MMPRMSLFKADVVSFDSVTFLWANCAETFMIWCQSIMVGCSEPAEK
jgi:hypothetical protein